MQRGRGFAARVLPEWIWARVEAHRPPLTQQKATDLINELLGPEAQPISITWYQRHAALRQWQAQRLALAAAQPAAQHPTPAEHDTLAPSAASIDPEQGAGEPPPHAANNPDASDGPSSPAHTPTDTRAQQAGQHDTLDATSPAGSFSIHSEDLDADWVDRVLASGHLHVPGKYSRHWPACPCPCAAVARRVPRAFCAAQASKHTLLLRRPPRQLRLRKSWAAS